MQLNIFKHKTIASIHIITMLMMFIFVVLFTSIVFYGEYHKFDENAKKLQKEYIEKQKESIVFDVQRVEKFIRYMYDKYHTTKSEEALKKEILNAIEHLYERQDGTGLYLTFAPKKHRNIIS